MADTSTVGIFSLNDVRLRELQGSWANASPILYVTDNNSKFNFVIDTQNQYRNQFLYYTISSPNSANSVAANSFADNSISGQLYANSSGFVSLEKEYLTQLTQKTFTLQLRTGSVSGPNVLSSSNITIAPIVRALGSQKDGSSYEKAALSAQAIIAATGTTTDGLYWIDLPTVGPQQVYCLMNPNANGGGWMMAMKATRGTTFNYSANYWTTANTLNPGFNTRADQDAKFDVMNYFSAKDILALWPDITTNGGGLGTNPYSCWSWLQNNFNDGTRITPIDFFNTAGTYNTGTVNTAGNYGGKFIGLAKSSSSWQSGIFSSQTSINFYGFNFKNYPGYGSFRTRWGFGWNENGEGNYSSPSSLAGVGYAGSNDVGGGIGMDTNFGNYSAGDYIGCCQDTTGINRTARVEIYIR